MKKKPLFCQTASPADIYDYPLLINELIKILVAQPEYPTPLITKFAIGFHLDSDPPNAQSERGSCRELAPLNQSTQNTYYITLYVV